MHYPWWHVPGLTAPMLIAFIAVVHVLVSLYAVGGGLFLATEVSHAYATDNRGYLDYLKQHAWFFILLTVVFGAITGVGIWWTIGLASPLATETLIQTFVFGWAMEYVFFVIEIIAAFIFFYYWDRLDASTHQAMGWIYAFSAWMSLVIITGITAFQLNPGDWVQTGGFWNGFFNPQFLPQTLARTGGAFLLASLYVYLHASFKCEAEDLRELIQHRSARPAMLGAILVTLGGAWWYVALPESAQAALEAAAPLQILFTALFAVTVVIFFFLYFGPFRNPGWLNPGFTVLLFLLGITAISEGEFIREAVRKPYIVYDVVLGNQILTSELDEIERKGFLESGVYTRAHVQQNYPSLVEDGRIDESRMSDLSTEKKRELGEVIFMHSCNDCHAAERGYSAVAPLMRGWQESQLERVAAHPERVHFFMPPFPGKQQEVEMLVEYLKTIRPPMPEGMRYRGERTGGAEEVRAGTGNGEGK